MPEDAALFSCPGHRELRYAVRIPPVEVIAAEPAFLKWKSGKP